MMKFLEKRIVETMRELNKTDNRDETLLLLGRLVTYYEIVTYMQAEDITNKKLNRLKNAIGLTLDLLGIDVKETENYA